MASTFYYTLRSFSMKPVMHSLVIAAALLSAVAQAQVSVKDAWVRGTVAQQRATGAFMQLTSPTDTRLVAVTTPIGTAALHEMSMGDGVMRMREVDGIALPAGKPVTLSSGGYHIMIEGLRQPVLPGVHVPLTLTFEASDKQRSTMVVDAIVQPLGATGAHP